MNEADHQSTNQHKSAGAEDDLEVEISDLSPEGESHFLLLKLLALRTRLLTLVRRFRPARKIVGQTPLSRRARRTRLSQMLTAAGLVVVLCALLLGNVPALRTRLVGLLAQPTPTPTALLDTNTLKNVTIIQDHPNDLPLASPEAGTIGPLPATCPRANSLQEFNSPLDPAGIGGSSIWLTGFSGPTAALTHVQKAPAPNSGWYATITLFTARGIKGPVILSGASQDHAQRLLFSDLATTKPVTAITVDLDASSGVVLGSQGTWSTTSITMYVAKAGCYDLEAFWYINASTANNWTIYFAAGSKA